MKILVDGDIHNFDGWLLNCEISHFDVEAVILDTINALTYVVSKARLAEVLKAGMVWDGASLMELSEQVVEFYNGTSIVDESVPIATDSAPGVKLLNNFFEVPWESQDVRMLLLIELLVSANPLIK